MRRKMAQERGMTLEEFNRYGITHASTDRDVDEWARGRAKQTGRGVFEGRTMFYFIPQSVKIFLNVSLHEAAKRIANDGTHLRRFEAGDNFRDMKTVEQALKRRIQNDSIRYRKHYKLNIFAKRNYDLWFDTTKSTPQKTLATILDYLEKNPPKTPKGEKQGRSPHLSTGRVKNLRKTFRTKKS